MMTADWYRERIAEWEAKSKAASEAGDYPAFQAAERELKNYREMLEGCKK